LKNTLRDLETASSRFLRNRVRIRAQAAEKKRYWMRLTNTCNNRCIFCLDYGRHDGSVRSIQEIKGELKKAINGGIDKLILSGGEPSIHHNFLEIVKMARKIGYTSIQVITNGRMFCYRNFLEEAVKNGVTEITFSFHGHTKKLYEGMTQIPGSYEQGLNALLNALKMKNLIVNVDIVINRINYKYLADILEFLIGLGVGEFDLLQVVPFGGAWENKKKVFYDIDKAMPYLQRAFLLQRKYPGIFIWTNRFPPRYLEGFEELIQNPVKLYDEARGRKYIFDKFINDDAIMPCFGEQCKHCFLEMFCKDLIELKEKKFIHGKKIAFCLKKYKFNSSVYKAKENIDAGDFLSFFIKERYFLKSLRCKDCINYNYCDGAPIDLIRKHGFEILKTIEK